MEWKIGCFTRPYQSYGLKRALEGISSAGFKYVGFMGKGFFPPTLTEQQLKEIGSLCQSYGLKPLVAYGEFNGYDKDGTVQFKKIIDNAVALGFDRVLIAGPWPYLEGINVRKPTSMWIREIEEFFKWIEAVSSYAGEKRVKIVLKPHAGITGTAKECLETMERIGSENVRIWYDPGNVVYYEGLRPQDVPEDLKLIVNYVDGICLKDSVGVRGGDICPPGQGKINFKEIFMVLKESGFNGPCIVEFGAPRGATLEEVDLIVKSSYHYVKKILAEI